MEHFPLPWRHENGLVKAVSHGKWFTVVRGGSKFTPDGVKANAAFIVRACNSHYDLVAALTRLLRAFESDKNVMPNCDVLTCWETNSMAIKQALDALAKAKGE